MGESTTPSRTVASPPDRRDRPGGIRVPGWAVTAVLASIAIGKIAWDASRTFSAIQQNQRIMDVRLCRIEAANHIPPWPTCGTYAAGETTLASQTP
jgi:hypothetical protein